MMPLEERLHDHMFIFRETLLKLSCVRNIGLEQAKDFPGNWLVWDMNTKCNPVEWAATIRFSLFIIISSFDKTVTALIFSMAWS